MAAIATCWGVAADWGNASVAAQAFKNNINEVQFMAGMRKNG